MQMRSAMEKWPCADLFCLRLLMFIFLMSFSRQTKIESACVSGVQVTLAVFWTFGKARHETSMMSKLVLQRTRRTSFMRNNLWPRSNEKGVAEPAVHQPQRPFGHLNCSNPMANANAPFGWKRSSLQTGTSIYVSYPPGGGFITVSRK